MDTYYERNKDIVKLRQRINYKLNKEKILNRRKELYHGESIINIKEKKLDYYYKNKERINNVHKEYNKNKYNSDVQFKIKTKFRTALSSYMIGKVDSSFISLYVNLTQDELVEYIQSLFTPDMSWDNYGKVWELDHIKPVCKFDLTVESDLHKCYYYTNLRPILKQHNRRKHNNVNQ